MRRAATAVGCLLLAASSAALALKVTLIVPANDARLERSRVERAYPGQPGGPAADGLRLALADSELELSASGMKLELDVVEAADANAAKAAAAKAEKAGAVAFVTDLPAAWTLAVADATSLPVLNSGEASDALREADCRRNLWHLLPSERMRADALAQTLVARKWTGVLLLTGPTPLDAARSATALAAIQRYGLKLAGSKPFKLSADPRERDLANPLLLTLGSYDVVWVVDSDGEFALSLPYRTALPRPVVGDAGLSALAWSAQFDRYGGPQVSRRLRKAVQRPMTSHDWAAWMAGKALVAAAVAVATPAQAGTAGNNGNSGNSGPKAAKASTSRKPWRRCRSTAAKAWR